MASMNPATKILGPSGLTCVFCQPGRYELVWNSEQAPAAAAPSAPKKRLPISRPVYMEIKRTLSLCPPEAGGLLLGPKDNRLVTHFLFDSAATSSPTSYTLDHHSLTEAVEPYLACGIDIKGIVHSHPPDRPEPTEGDRRYLIRLLANPRNAADELFFPVHCDGRLRGFVITPESLKKSREWAMPVQIVLL